MKIALVSTEKVVQLETPAGTVPARIWQGETVDGIPVHAYITRIVPEVPTSDPDIDAKTAAFESDLQRCADPRPAVQAIPLRMVL